ncbi:hypothetical protein ACFSTH_01030 [Paenibacillus yanchengensis]
MNETNFQKNASASWANLRLTPIGKAWSRFTGGGDFNYRICKEENYFD